MMIQIEGRHSHNSKNQTGVPSFHHFLHYIQARACSEFHVALPLAWNPTGQKELHLKNPICEKGCKRYLET